jgi:exodeoxyribonuclease V beta subunit
MWQQQGVLAMLHHWLHSQGIASRLLARDNGERLISNVLHLGELLQHAAQSLQGEHALVRFLGEQIHKPTQSADTQKMRLETDAQCVQVITYHKSKGLQYPWCLCHLLAALKPRVRLNLVLSMTIKAMTTPLSPHQSMKTCV